MAYNFYGAISLTGGGTGALDVIDGTSLKTGDAAYVITSAGFYVYYLDGSSGASESSPDIISPDTNAGNKRWILQSVGVFYLKDTDSSNTLELKWNEDDSLDRVLNFKVNSGNRTLDLSEDFTLADGQNLTITVEDAASSVVLDNINFEVENTDGTQRTIKITSAKAGNTTLTLNENLTIGDGSDVTITAEDAAGAITLDNMNLEVEDTIGSGNTIKIANATDDASRTITLSEDLTILDGNPAKIVFSNLATLTVENDSIVNQDLTSDAIPTFASVNLTNVTDYNIPAMASAATGFTDSPLSTDGVDVTNTGKFNATTIDLTGITDGNIPNMASGAAGFENSPLSTDGTNLTSTGKFTATALVSGATTATASGPIDDLDVSGVNLVLIDASSNAVTIGGFTGGVVGQRIALAIINYTNDVTIEHNEGTGNQDIFLSYGDDEILSGQYGGWVLACDGSNWYEESAGGGGGLSWSIVSSDTNAKNANGYLVNATSGNVTITLPSSPTIGDTVGACDAYSKATTNIIKLGRNGENIESVASDLVIDIDGAGFTLVYTGATIGWKIVSEISRGGSLNIVVDTTPQLGGDLDYNSYSIVDSSGNEVLSFASTATAVNGITIENAATGSGPEIQATGDDTNIDIELIPQGTGEVVVSGDISADTADLTDITDTNIPYMGSAGFVDSPLTTDGTDVTASGDLTVTTDLVVSGSVAADLDFGGNYATSLQNVADLASKGPSYWFDGVDDYVSVADDDDNLNPRTGDFSIISMIKSTGVVSNYPTIFESKEAAAVNDSFGLYIWNTGYLYGAMQESSTSVVVTSNKTDFDGDTMWHIVGFTIDRDSVTGMKLYVDGSEETYSTQTNPTALTGDVNPGGAKYIGTDISETYPFNGQISRTLLFNLALSAAEVKALSSGAEVPFKYVGASQTNLMTNGGFEAGISSPPASWGSLGAGVVGTSVADGTAPEGSNVAEIVCTVGGSTSNNFRQTIGSILTVGKQYEITYYAKSISGNTSYTVWINKTVDEAFTETITGSWVQYSLKFIAGQVDTDFRTWLGGAGTVRVDCFTLTQIGCVLDLNPDGIGPSQWLDASGNSLHGTVSGAKATNIPVQDRAWNQVNLLGNSGFGVWSNSEDLFDATTGAAPVVTGANAALIAGGSLVTNGGFDSATTGWTAGNSATLSSDAGDGETGNRLTVAENGANYPYAYQGITTEVGKLYELNVYVKAGTEATYRVYIGESPGTSGENSSEIGEETAGDWSTIVNIVFEATATTTYVTFYCWAASGAGTTMWFDTVTLNEVTPGIVSATTAGPDSWKRSAATLYPDLYRQHNDVTYTKAGSFYSLKYVGDNSTGCIYQVPFSSTRTDPITISKVAGRTMTFGAWVWSASAVRIYFSATERGYFTSQHAAYTAHSGGSDWEWLEVTYTFAAAPTAAVVGFYGAANEDMWVSQPMLVFGSHIGEGNAIAPPREQVFCENKIILYNYTSISPTDDGILNLEALSNGKIPKGAKEITALMNITSSSIASAQGIQLRTSGSGGIPVQLECNPPVNNIRHYANGIVTCDSNGDIYQNVTEADDVLSAYYVEISRIKVN